MNNKWESMDATKYIKLEKRILITFQLLGVFPILTVLFLLIVYFVSAFQLGYLPTAETSGPDFSDKYLLIPSSVLILMSLATYYGLIITISLLILLIIIKVFFRNSLDVDFKKVAWAFVGYLLIIAFFVLPGIKEITYWYYN